MSFHTIRREQAHLAWDNSLAPVLTVSNGDSIVFDCLDASNGQLDASSDATSVAALDFARLDQVNGPVHVKGARAGDVLKVELLDLEPAAWGWTALVPGFGLLADDPEFTAPALRLWSIDATAGTARTTMGTREVFVPLRPFMGEVGIARGTAGAWSTIPPYRTGGNMDTKHLTKGSTVYLPIEVEGALFSIGDGHAAQGDGEVCGTAIETPMKVTVKLTVLSGKDAPLHGALAAPHYETKSATREGEEYYATTGIGPDIREATRDAVRGMIAYLAEAHNFAKTDAYMLCSVAADLRLHEVVDMPNYVVGMMLPKSILA